MLRGYRFFVGIGGNKEFYIDIELKKKRFVQIQGGFFQSLFFWYHNIWWSYFLFVFFLSF